MSTEFTHALVCPPADSFADGITVAGLGAPDLAIAKRQHAAYSAALEAAGVTITVLPADHGYPDSTFVEDTVLVTARGAILARPGAPSRLGEVAAMRAALEDRYPDLAEIRHPGTLDGGDICQVGDHFFIGLSQRTNVSGADQLVGWLGRHDYTATVIAIGRDPTLLHLKSGLAWLGDDRLVVVPSLARQRELRGHELITVERDEAYAANCVRVNDVVLIPADFPRIAETLDRLGYRVVALQMSEFQKMDGGLSCLSVRA